jgi:hypothetical protein
MSATKSRQRKPQGPSPWCGPDVDPQSLTPNQRAAHDLVSQRRDLTPSVTRIMDADLSEAARTSALDAFRTSLTTPGDPNRDPVVAITNAANGR